MQDEIDRDAGVISSARPPTPVRLEMLDVEEAIASAERLARSRVLGGPRANGELGAALAEAFALTSEGARAAIVAPIEQLASSREALRRWVSARRGVVVHALAGHGAEELGALADLGCGVLCASGPDDSLDLALVARRASEDSGVPFVVVHALGRAGHPAGRALALVARPSDDVLAAFVGEASPARSRDELDGARAFAGRAPFALAAALRDFGAATGRRRDTFDKAPLGEASIVLLGAGAVGEALLAATGELRARGYDVGAIGISSLRPFPGPRLVKALARALAITILEPADEPLAPGALLARDVKAAFTDALTWAPGFPGIGHIPKLFAGATGSAFDVSDLAAACENMLADERGRRVFSFAAAEHALPRARALAPDARDGKERAIALRLVLDDDAPPDAVLGTLSAALAAAAGLRTQAVVTAAGPGPGSIVDVVASRDGARGGMARRPPRLVLATERGLASAGAVMPIAEGAVLALVGVAPGAVLPEAVRAAVRERRARVLSLGSVDPGSSASLAASAAGASLALAARALGLPLDGASASRAVAEAGGADAARHVFDATAEALTWAPPSVRPPSAA